MSLTAKLLKYIDYTKEYGKPSDEAIDYFIQSPVAQEILMAPHYIGDDVIKKSADTLWSSIIKRLSSDESCYVKPKYNGGFNFYKYLSEKQITEENFRQIIEAYEADPNDTFEYEKPVDKETAPKDNTGLIEADHAKTADEASESKTAETSKTAESSDVAHSLDENAKQQVAGIYAEKEREKQEEQGRKLKDLSYEFKQSEPYKSKTLQYNNRQFELGLFWLDSNYTLYITGMSRSGKTYITKEIAGKYIGIDTSNLKMDTVAYEHMLWVNSTMNKSEFRELFAKFCNHNVNSDKCLVVFNEASKRDFMNLVPFWEEMDADGNSFKDSISQGLSFEYHDIPINIPKNLRIIANIANEQYDIQMENRFGKRLDLDDITSEDIEDISNYTSIPENILEILIKVQDKIARDWGNEKRFICVYKLKKNKKLELQYYIDKCWRVFSKDFEEMKKTIQEYIASI